MIPEMMDVWSPRAKANRCPAALALAQSQAPDLTWRALRHTSESRDESLKVVSSDAWAHVALDGDDRQLALADERADQPLRDPEEPSRLAVRQE